MNIAGTARKITPAAAWPDFALVNFRITASEMVRAAGATPAASSLLRSPRKGKIKPQQGAQRGANGPQAHPGAPGGHPARDGLALRQNAAKNLRKCLGIMKLRTFLSRYVQRSAARCSAASPGGY